METAQGLTPYRAFRVSWTAYLGRAIKFAIIAAIVSGIYYLVAQTRPAIDWLKGWLWESVAQKIPFGTIEGYLTPQVLEIALLVYIALIAFGVILLIYRFYWLRRVVLYTNEDGVWLSRGLLHRKKGIKWDDIDSASFQSFSLSWVLQTYTVTVAHKLTENSGIVQKSIFRGKAAVSHINKLHAEYIKTQQPV
ncbi:hypothetical protein AGMMS50229_08990 [Campylobacterota bacterium]|nr:hypothetical protein AGMMS50229_08990 [Campylobacterota bacterium]